MLVISILSSCLHISAFPLSIRQEEDMIFGPTLPRQFGSFLRPEPAAGSTIFFFDKDKLLYRTHCKYWEILRCVATLLVSLSFIIEHFDEERSAIEAIVGFRDRSRSCTSATGGVCLREGQGG